MGKNYQPHTTFIIQMTCLIRFSDISLDGIHIGKIKLDANTWEMFEGFAHQKMQSWGWYHMDVSENSGTRGTPKSSILIGFSIINHPFWGIPIFFGNTHIMNSVDLIDFSQEKCQPNGKNIILSPCGCRVTGKEVTNAVPTRRVEEYPP